MKLTEPNLKTSAVITIDMQNDFVNKDGASPVSGTDEVVENISKILSLARDKKIPIIHIVRLYKHDGVNVDLCRREMIQGGKKIVLPGSEGAELHSALKPDDQIKLDAELLLKGKPQRAGNNEWYIYKSRWGAFYETALQSHLQELGINSLIFCGCNFPNCPRTSIFEASERDYKLITVKDALSKIYARGEEELVNIGVHLYTTDELIKAMNSQL